MRLFRRAILFHLDIQYAAALSLINSTIGLLVTTITYLHHTKAFNSCSCSCSAFASKCADSSGDTNCDFRRPNGGLAEGGDGHGCPSSAAPQDGAFSAV
ncbi:hypothetical protein C1X77_22445, partial [Pseudomonas sp. GW531-E2]